MGRRVGAPEKLRQVRYPKHEINDRLSSRHRKEQEGCNTYCFNCCHCWLPSFM